MALPVSLLKTECLSYQLLPYEIGEEEAAALLESRLLQWLRQTAPDAEVVQTWFAVESGDGVLRVRMLAQCREDIAVEREITLPQP